MTTPLTITSTLPLHNTSHEIPRLGFGIYTSTGEVCTTSCLTAFRAGYRHIDSAQYYENEEQVGEAVRRCGIPRSELFLTTKIAEPLNSPQETYKSIKDSVRRMNGGSEEGAYVDLMLMHDGDIGKEKTKELWTQLEKAYQEGLCRSIGISNAGRGHIEAMREYATIWPPQVNQIELHPWCQQRDAVAYCQAHSIVLQAYAPLVKNQKADDPTLNRLAEKYNKSTAQILIRYSLQKGWVPLPKSDTPSRIVANADVFDFSIEGKDMTVLDGLDQGKEGAVYEAVENDPYQRE